MKNLLLLLTAILFIASCDQKETVTPELVDGTYVGIFGRSSPNAKYASAKVTLTLNNGAFTGSSDITNYPAICSGTFKILGETVEFSNNCMFTANFDWTYILNGSFNLKIEENKIYLTRSYGEVHDRYELEKQ